MLESARLWLAPLADLAAHRALYGALYSDAAVMRWVDRPVPAARMSASFDASLEASQAAPALPSRWCLERRADGSLVGLAGALHEPESGRVEMGVLLLPGFQSQGYAREAFEVLMTEFSRQVDVRSYWSRHHPQNRAMSRVLERLGYTRGAMEDGLSRWERPAGPCVRR